MLHLELDIAFKYLAEYRPELKTGILQFVFRSKDSREIDMLEGKRETLRAHVCVLSSR